MILVQMKRKNNTRFRVEATLGKLAKWLRILGFDTLYGPDVMAKGFVDAEEGSRILLTRTKSTLNRKTLQKIIFITSNNPFEQLKEVTNELGIVLEDTQPFSRCTHCNAPIRKVKKNFVQRKVPDHIWETHTIFHTCSQCQRIYWPGSHIEHSLDIIKKIFDS